MGELFKPFLISLLIAFITTPVVRRFAIKIGAVDIPKDNRRMHKAPMPYLGGVAIYLAVIITVLVFAPLTRENIAIILGGTIIAISGVIDDIKDLSPRKKILFQLAAGIVLLIGGIKVEFFTNPFASGNTIVNLGLLSIPITLFWVVGITNTVNLIDGLDGLAAGVSMISSLSLMFVANKFGNSEISLIAAILAGACLGFLPYNFNPAKIFMGDTGALFLGFMLSAISVEGVMKSAATIAIVVPVLILGIPIFDTAFAICRRLLNGQSISSADKGHLHHRLLETGLSQKSTVLVLYGISAVFGIFSVLIAKVNSKQSFYLAIVLFVLSVILAKKIGIFEKRD